MPRRGWAGAAPARKLPACPRQGVSPQDGKGYKIDRAIRALREAAVEHGVHWRVEELRTALGKEVGVHTAYLGVDRSTGEYRMVEWNPDQLMIGDDQADDAEADDESPPGPRGVVAGDKE